MCVARPSFHALYLVILWRQVSPTSQSPIKALRLHAAKKGEEEPRILLITCQESSRKQGKFHGKFIQKKVTVAMWSELYLGLGHAEEGRRNLIEKRLEQNDIVEGRNGKGL